MIIFSVILFFQVASSFVQSKIIDCPICRHQLGLSPEDSQYEIRGSILLSNKLFFIVSESNPARKHVVYEIPLQDVNLQESAIYLDNSNPIPMKVKWGFEPTESNRHIVTAFGMRRFTPNPSGIIEIQEDVVFVDSNDSITMLNLATLKLNENINDKWNLTGGSIVQSLDNDGYIFGKSTTRNQWYMREFDLHRESFHFVNEHRYYIGDSRENRYLQLSRFETQFSQLDHFVLSDHASFSGFIFYDHLILFHHHDTAYIVRDNRAFSKIATEYVLPYEQIRFKRLFRCHRYADESEVDARGELDSNSPLDEYYENQPILVNFSLFALLIIVMISFYIRSKILQNKSIKCVSGRRMFHYNSY